MRDIFRDSISYAMTALYWFLETLFLSNLPMHDIKAVLVVFVKRLIVTKRQDESRQQHNPWVGLTKLSRNVWT